MEEKLAVAVQSYMLCGRKHILLCKVFESTMAWQRIAAQVIITATQVVGKAFVQAYRQAAVNAGKEGAKAAGGIVKRGQMTEGEALQILNVKKLPDGELPIREEVEDNYLKFFEANDPAQGGSYYLQSKFFRAHEFLEQHRLELEEEKANEEAKAASATDDSGGPDEKKSG